MKQKQNLSEGKEKKRVAIYDWVRLLATIWVVIGHSAYLDDAGEHGSVVFTLPANLSPVYNDLPLRAVRFLSGFVYTFHMPLFFMLSGAVLALTMQKSAQRPSFDSFARKKARRLVLPYFLCGYLFMLPVKLLIGYYDAKTFPEALAGFFIGEDAGHLWFLPALFWSLLLYMAIRRLLARLGITSEWAPFLVCFVLSFSYTLCPITFFGFQTALDYLIWVALGFAFELWRQKKKPLSLPVLAGGLLLLLILEGLHKKYLILHYLAAILCGCAMTYVMARILEILFPKLSETKGFSLIARNLFAVYLFHDPLEFVILKLYFHFDLLSAAAGCYIYTLLRTVGVFVLSLLAGELLRRAVSRFRRS